MQSYAEGFEIMSTRDDLDAHEISGICANGSGRRSFELLACGIRETHGSKLEDIAPYVEDSGEGRWTINERSTRTCRCR